MTVLRLPSHLLLPQFRQDPEAYVQARKLWEALFESVVEKARSNWQPWIGDPFRDGNAIFSRVSRRGRKGIIINQILPSDDSLLFKSWMGVFGSPDHEDEIEHLTIACMLTADSLKSAEFLIDCYVNRRLSYDEMTRLTAELTHEAGEYDDGRVRARR